MSTYDMEPTTLILERAERFNTTPEIINTAVAAFYDDQQQTDAGQKLVQTFPTGCTLQEAVEFFKICPPFGVGDMVRGHDMLAVNNWRDQTPRAATEVLVVTSVKGEMLTAVNGAGDRYQALLSQFTPLFKKLINFHYSDVDVVRANDCHNGTSWTPDRRGYLFADDYASTMSRIDERFSAFVTDENREELIAALEVYRVKYLSLMWAYLHSHSNVISSAVTGPSNFPSARAKKRSQWADNHLNAWIEWQKQAESRLEKQFNPKVIARAPISSDDPDALERLQEKLAKLEQLHERMKAANKIVFNTKKSDAEKKAELAALLNLPEEKAGQLLQPDFCGRIGFAGYQLTNNNANIKRIRDRIAILTRNQRAETSEQRIGDVTIIEDVENNRVKVMFPERLSSDMYQAMRHAGFVYSRTNSAFQRKRSPQATYLAQQIAAQYHNECLQ